MFKKFINRLFFSFILIGRIIPLAPAVTDEGWAYRIIENLFLKLRFVIFFSVSGFAVSAWRIYPKLIFLWGILYILALYYAYRKTDMDMLYNYDKCCEIYEKDSCVKKVFWSIFSILFVLLAWLLCVSSIVIFIMIASIPDFFVSYIKFY